MSGYVLGLMSAINKATRITSELANSASVGVTHDRRFATRNVLQNVHTNSLVWRVQHSNLFGVYPV
jgi:hypothetical protein